MNKPFGSFRPGVKEQGPKNVQEIINTNEDTAKKEFKRVLEGRFSQIVPGRFITKYPDIIFTISPSPDRKAITVLPFFKDQEGKEQHMTLTITKDADVIPDRVGGLKPSLREQICAANPNYKNLPDRLKNRVALNDILTETAYIESLLHLDKFMKLEEGEVEVLIPPGEWYPNRGDKKAEKERLKKLNIDPKRIDFMFSISGVVCGIRPDVLTRVKYGKDYGPGIPLSEGLSDYHAFIFPKGAICECAVCENAVYEFPFAKQIPAEIIKQRAEGNEKPLRDFLAEIGFYGKMRQQKINLIKLGQKYGNHPPINARPENIKEWQEELKKHIQENYI